MPFSVTVARTALTRSEKVQHLQGQPNKKRPRITCGGVLYVLPYSQYYNSAIFVNNLCLGYNGIKGTTKRGDTCGQYADVSRTIKPQTLDFKHFEDFSRSIVPH